MMSKFNQYNTRVLLHWTRFNNDCKIPCFLSINSSQRQQVAKILLRDECSIDGGTVHWHFTPEQPSQQILQFRKAGDQSFTVCFTFPEPSSSTSISVHQLRGVSRKMIHSTIEEGPNDTVAVCVESQCSHVTLLLQSYEKEDEVADTSNGLSVTTKDVLSITYQFAVDRS